ncbi:hypothetical protein ACLMJK_000430 [Lecanora helva]
MEDPPPELSYIAEKLDYVFDPFSTFQDRQNAGVLWPEPFSQWLRVLVTFGIWALPDSVAELTPDAPGLLEDEADDDESNVLSMPASPNTPARTTWTLLIYLTGPSTGCVGGETVFYPDLGTAKTFSGKSNDGTKPLAVELEVGLALLHKHGLDCLLHEGREVTKGEKWVIRTDLCVKK